MKVLGIVCSPRPEGNTRILVEEALLGAAELGAEVELYQAGTKRISPCQACDHCWEAGACRLDDDMQELYRKMEEADGIILGSPVYFWSVSAQAKAVIDRTYAFRRGRKLRDKFGGAIVVARKRGHGGAMSSITAFFSSHYLITAGTAAALARTPGEALQDQRGMRDARRLGKVMASLIQARRIAAMHR